MAIGLNDLDTSIVNALGEVLHPLYFDLSARKGPEQKRLFAALTQYRWLGSGSIFPPIAAFGCVMAGAQLGNQASLMWGLFAASFAISGASLWNTFHRDLMVGFRTSLPTEVLVAALPLMQLSPLEAVYAHTVALLTAFQGKGSEPNARNILARLNELLANNRELESRREALAEAVAQHAVAPLEADRAQLKERLRNTEDSVTRISLYQSLQMCESRLEDARAMEQNLQRVSAQQEAIHSTLAFAQSTLIRMQTTPSLASPAVEELTQALTQVTVQTRSEEAAVQEVANLLAN